MTVHLRTRVEISCWNLIIPMMTKLRYIRSAPKSRAAQLLSPKQAAIQIFVWSATGLFIGFGISAVSIMLW